MNVMHEIKRDIWVTVGYALLGLCGLAFGFLMTLVFLIVRSQLQFP
jgi:tetrahydromethanopterin S-methyltransferase subunit F